MLTRVRTVYGDYTYVETEQLNGTARMLRSYNADGSRTKMWIGPSASDWSNGVLHRDNICPHGDEHWQDAKFPDGTTYRTCCACASS